MYISLPTTPIVCCRITPRNCGIRIRLYVIADVTAVLINMAYDNEDKILINKV